MFIRRKVYSVIEDENGEQKLFSTTEFINEDEYVKTFSDKKEVAKKAGIAGGGAVVGAGGTIYGGKKLGEYLQKKGWGKVAEAATNTNLTPEQLEKLEKTAEKQLKTGRILRTPADAIETAAKNTAEGIKKGAEATGKGVAKGAKYTKVISSKEGRRVLKAIKKAKK